MTESDSSQKCPVCGSEDVFPGWVRPITEIPPMFLPDDGALIPTPYGVSAVACVECGVVSTFLSATGRRELAARLRRMTKSAE